MDIDIKRSGKIRDKIFRLIHENKISNEDLVKIVSYINNDILNAQTRVSYSKQINPRTGKKRCYNSHQFAKGIRFKLKGIEFITDNE